MDYENKIKELTNRIEKLEKEENKRIIKRKIKITWTIVKIVTILIIALVTYHYIQNKIIKPINTVEEKINTVETSIQEKWKTIKKYIPFMTT